ncbi:hypothetical protein A2U01_0073339, partial [Trifolium medium]|nr:hypothetical protein [Trifolium medium]
CGSSTRSLVNLEANEGGVVDEALRPPSAKKSTCNLRSRVVGRTEIPVKACSSGDQEIKVLHVNMPETLLPPPAASDRTSVEDHSPWGPSFDPVAFIER